MTTTRSTVPSWIVYYLGFVSIVSAIFAIIVYADASVVWSDWPAIDAPGAKDVGGPAGLFAARNVATAAMGAYALFHRSQPMMELLLVFRIVVDVLDGVHGVISGTPQVIAIGFVAATIEILMYRRLRAARS